MKSEKKLTLKTSRTYYHVTPESRVSSILRQGFGNREVYVSKSIETAKDWVENLSDNDEDRMAIIKVVLPKGTKVEERYWPETETVFRGKDSQASVKVVGFYNPEKGLLVRLSK